MTREEAKNWLNKLYARADITDEYGDAEDVQPYEEAIDMAIKALEQELCEDVPEINVGDIISRQAVLDKKELVELEDGQSFYCISPEDVETLPPVTPQPKTGHWIDNGICYECSECGIIRAKGKTGKYNYCPSCGSYNGGD